VDIVIIVVAAVVVLVVGLVSVGSAVGKTRTMPDQIVIDAHEAIEFCAEALPGDVTAVLSYDQLRRLLRLHLEWIQAHHWAPETNRSAAKKTELSGPILFEEFDPADYVMERASAVGLSVTRDHALATIQAHSAYLRVVGALHQDDPALMEADLNEVQALDDSAPSSELTTGPTEETP